MIENTDIQMFIDTALKGEHKDFAPIVGYLDFLTAKQTRKALLKVSKIFKRLQNQLFTEYLGKCFSLSEVQKVDQLITIRNMDLCYQYYTEEVNLLNNRIEEYREYLRNPANFGISEN